MSPRAVGLLAALALGLALLTLVDRPTAPPGAGADRVFPELTGGSVSRLVLTRANGAATVVERRGERFTVDDAPAAEAAVRELVDTLGGLAVRRRLPRGDGAARGLDPPLFTLEVTIELTGGSVSRRLAVGRTEPALGRAWARRLDPGAPAEDLEIDAYAARALDREPGELRRRAPFEAAPAPARIALAPRDGEPVRLREGCVEHGGACVLADGRRVAELLDHLADLRVSSFLAAPPAGDPELRVEVDGAWIAIHGACPVAETDRAVSSSLGAGCIPAEQLAPVLDAPRDALAWVERRVSGLGAAEIDRIAAGPTVLVRRGAIWRQGDIELSADAVREWLDALLALEGTPRWAELTGGSVSRLTLAAGDRQETALLADGPDGPTVGRAGEPLALRFPAALRDRWRLDPALLADRRVIDVDATRVSAIRIEERGAPPEVVERGASLERWRLTAPLALDADGGGVTALRDAAAGLTARSVLAASPGAEHGLAPPRRRITLVLDAAPGAEAGEAVLELGAARDGGCAARRGDGPVFLIAPERCAALGAHLATRAVLPPLDEIVAPRGERDALLAALATAAEVVGYGPLAGAPLLTVGTTRGPIELVRAGDLYARRDRAVRYRLSPEALRLLR